MTSIQIKTEKNLAMKTKQRPDVVGLWNNSYKKKVQTASLDPITKQIMYLRQRYHSIHIQHPMFFFVGTPSTGREKHDIVQF